MKSTEQDMMTLAGDREALAETIRTASKGRGKAARRAAARIRKQRRSIARRKGR